MSISVTDFINLATVKVSAPWATIESRPSLTQPMCVRFNFSVNIYMIVLGSQWRFWYWHP